MKPVPALLLLAIGVCLEAQTAAPPQPSKPSVTTPDSSTVPVELISPRLTTLPPDRVLIQVNDTRITAGQLDDILAAYPENTQVFARGPGRQQFIDGVVRTLVLSEEGKRRKLDETPKYQTQAQYSLAGILANHTNKEIKKSIVVDDESLKKYLEDHQREYQMVRVRQILVRVKGSPTPIRPGTMELTDEEALAKARELHDRILSGADFAEVAKAESDDTSSGVKGGEIGTFARGQMAMALEDQVFQLEKPGDMTEPVKSQFGYHLIQLEDKPKKSLDELRSELEMKVRPELARKQVDEMVNKAKVILDPDLIPASKISK